MTPRPQRSNETAKGGHVLWPHRWLCLNIDLFPLPGVAQYDQPNYFVPLVLQRSIVGVEMY
ncbi:hypothetical protein GB937_009561 [Aspergillus fischeri]|nr:hypothetical protein GB937_009561 [Aspergillus fischeri]